MTDARLRAVLVFNPNATTTDASVRDVIAAALASEVDLDVQPTKMRGHATHIVSGAIHDGVDAVFALGGDGTANEVVQAMAGTAAVLGVIPGGSTNVFARALGLPNDPVQATKVLLDAVRSGHDRHVGLGRAGGRYFTFHAGFGFDAAVVRAVEQAPGLKRRLRQGAFVWQATRTFFADADRAAGTLQVVTGDGTTVGPGSIAIVGNTTPYTWLGTHPLHVTPDASLATGLDLALIGPVSATRLLRLLAGLRGGRGLVAGDDVTMLHDRNRLTLTSTVPRPLQVDGDYAGEFTEVRLESIPRALRVFGQRTEPTVELASADLGR